MSQQLQITGGAKVRDLQDVIIGTSGVLSSLAFNVANGVPKLDSNGKILVSQLPNSVMEYQGTWNANTNTPTLVNGTGNQGDFYLCNVAGTTNFGAGPLTFAVGDSAIYSGSIWQKAGGATGTVTSVGLTSTGNDAITITGSPITTSGNINLGFAGTNLQYINGTGDLTTFPTLISSIGLSMPSAFSVANSPLTANGTIAVTGAGYPSQYIRGDGTLADFPTSGGGGSSVSYYLNGGTSQGTIGGVTYYEMSKTADTGTGVDFTKTGDGLIVSFLTDANDPAQLNIPAGNWNYEIYASMSSNGGTPQLYAELYVYNGTTFTLISTSSNEILYDGVNLNLYTFAMTVPATTLALTDRLAIKLYATNSGGKTTTVHTQDSHLCQIITTFSTGITALNGLTAQVQYFATGTSGTDFNIVSSVDTHTFNIPSASATNRGLITTGTQTIAGDKTFSGSTILNGAIDINNSLIVNSGFFIRNNVIGSTLYTSFSINKASNIETIQFLYSTGFSSRLLFNDAATYSYTFPNATGTLALTSNLSSYLPLTGGTLTGVLNGTVLNLSSILYMENNVSIYMKNTTSTYYAVLSINVNNKVSIDSSGLGVDFGGTIGNGTYAYTLPSATGTLALTSNLSSYVPYTGATGSVNLGGFGITASSLSVTNTSTFNGNIILKKAGLGVTTPTYLTQFATSTGVGIGYSDGTGGANFILQTAAIYDYTFPAATGTLALLEGSQTFTGINTFSAASVNIAPTSGAGGILNLKRGAYTGGINDYTSLISQGDNFGIASLTSSSNRSILFDFASITSGILRTYTLPNLSGTLALTSDLSSYVTLATTQTISANKTFSEFGFFDKGVLLKQNIYPSASGYNGIGAIAGGFYFSLGQTTVQTLLFSTTTPYQYTFPNATGTLALGTGTTNYHAKWTGTNTIGNSLIWDNGTNVGIGNTNTSYTLDVSGTGRFTGTTILASTSGSVGVAVTPSGWGSGYIGFQVGPAGSQMATGNNNRIGLNFYYDGGASFKAIQTGAASLIEFDGDNIRFKNAASVSGGAAQTINERLTITSAGNVGIGTSSPSRKLDVLADAIKLGDTGSFLFDMNVGASSGYFISFGIGATNIFRMRGDGYLQAAPTYNNTTSNAVNMTISSNGYIERFVASSLRYKENIVEWDGNGLQTILSLKPVKYTYKSGYYKLPNKIMLGLIAEEVEKVCNYFVDYENEDRTGVVENVRYADLVLPLIKAVQEQNQTIQELSKQNEELSNRLIKLESK
jgi:hypothetical protein